MAKPKPDDVRYLGWAIVLLAVWQVSTWAVWGGGPYGGRERSFSEPHVSKHTDA